MRDGEGDRDQAAAHAGERKDDGSLAADLADDRAGDEAHDAGEDDRPDEQVGNLGGVEAEDVHADVVDAGVQGVAEEVADEDDDHGHGEGRVGQHLRRDEGVLGLVDVDDEGNQGHDAGDEPEGGHIREVHGHGSREQADEGEAHDVDGRTGGVVVGQVLGKDGDQRSGDDADAEQDAPVDEGHVAGEEDAEGGGEAEDRNEDAVPDHAILLGYVLGHQNQEDGAGDLPADGLDEAGEDDDPDAQAAEEAEHGARDEDGGADDDHLAKRQEVTERAVDDADDAECDARDRGDEGREVGLAELIADVDVDHAERLLHQDAQREDGQNNGDGDLRHLVQLEPFRSPLLGNGNAVLLLFCHAISPFIFDDRAVCIQAAFGRT